MASSSRARRGARRALALALLLAALAFLSLSTSPSAPASRDASEGGRARRSGRASRVPGDDPSHIRLPGSSSRAGSSVLPRVSSSGRDLGEALEEARSLRDRASRVSRVDPTVARARMRGKVAFLFLTSVSMPQYPVWGKFFADADASEYEIYVNANPGAPPQRGVFAGREVANPVKTTWGTFTIVRATIHLLKVALEDPENVRFALVSDNAVPFASFHAARCALLADPRSVINACNVDHFGLARENHDHLIRMPPDFPPWLNASSWRKSSQWWVLNRDHAALASSEDRVAEEFERKCYQKFTHRDPTVPSVRSCYADEHYFATVLALRGQEHMTTCSEGVTYVNWETYTSGHPKTYWSVGELTRERRKKPRVELLSCGERAKPRDAWVAERIDGAVCGDANDGAHGGGGGPGGGGLSVPPREEDFPRLDLCLFARKVPDALAKAFADAWETKEWR